MSLMEDLRVRVGLPPDDTSKDAEITVAKETAFALMGNYCDRVFPGQDDYVETFTHLAGMSVRLALYPIGTIASVVDENDVDFSQYHIEAKTGNLHLDEHRSFHLVTVTHSSGYDEDAMPADLLMAFYAVFDQEYAHVTGTASVSSGEISSITVTDVGTVRYNTSSSSSGSGGSADYIPARAQGLLEAYKRLSC